MVAGVGKAVSPAYPGCLGVSMGWRIGTLHLRGSMRLRLQVEVEAAAVAHMVKYFQPVDLLVDSDSPAVVYSFSS